jgi:hypothetical protein
MAAGPPPGKGQRLGAVTPDGRSAVADRRRCQGSVMPDSRCPTVTTAGVAALRRIHHSNRPRPGRAAADRRSHMEGQRRRPVIKPRDRTAQAPAATSGDHPAAGRRLGEVQPVPGPRHRHHQSRPAARQVNRTFTSNLGNSTLRRHSRLFASAYTLPGRITTGGAVVRGRLGSSDRWQSESRSQPVTLLYASANG